MQKVESTLAPVEEGKVKISVVIDEAEVEEAVESAFREIASQARIKGFRPGKVPRKVLEARLGSGYARRRALVDLVENSYRKAVVRHDVDVIAAAQLDIIAGEEEGPVSYEAVVEVRPSVNVAGYDAIRVEIDPPEATEEEIVSEVEALRAQFGELEEVARPAVDGDHVKIDVNTKYEGEEVDSLCVQDYLYELGSGGVVEEVDENLRGASVGNILKFNSPHPNSEVSGHLSFSILVKAVNSRRLPPLDDDFAARSSEFDTVEELRTDIAERIEASKRVMAARQLQTKTLDALAKLVIEEPPETLVEDEIRRQIEGLEGFFERQGKDFEEYLQASERSRKDLEEETRPSAQESVRIDLGLRAVAAAEGIESDQAELWAEAQRAAEAAGVSPEEIRRRMDESGGWLGVRAELGKRKALQWLLEHVEATDGSGNAVDTQSLLPPGGGSGSGSGEEKGGGEETSGGEESSGGEETSGGEESSESSGGEERQGGEDAADESPGALASSETPATKSSAS